MSYNRPPQSVLTRLEGRISFSEGCWEWTGAKFAEGYGVISVGRRGEAKRLMAHRVVYEFLVGPIPDDLVIDHLCRNTSCVNPSHLEPVTNVENLQRGINAYSVRMHCPKGHPYDEANTGPTTDGRRCRACHRERERIRQAKRRAGQ